MGETGGLKSGVIMIAVIRTGGKQYTVAADQELTVERIAGEAGAKIEFTAALAKALGVKKYRMTR